MPVRSDATLDNVAYGFMTHISGASADNDLQQMAVNGVGDNTAVFALTVTSNKMLVRQLDIAVLAAAQTPATFGGLAALTSGVQIIGADADGSTVVDFLDGNAIKANFEWTWIAGVGENDVQAAAGDDLLSVEWNVARTMGAPLALYSGESLRFIVRDNITAVTDFRCMVQGRTLD